MWYLYLGKNMPVIYIYSMYTFCITYICIYGAYVSAHIMYMLNSAVLQ